MIRNALGLLVGVSLFVAAAAVATTLRLSDPDSTLVEAFAILQAVILATLGSFFIDDWTEGLHKRVTTAKEKRRTSVRRS
jgi:hypothetical protein